MEIIVSKKFQKDAKKLIQSRPNLKPKINQMVLDLSHKDRESKFYRKKLKGDLVPYEELQIGGDIRIIAFFQGKRVVLRTHWYV